MPKINFDQNCKMSATEAFGKVKTMLADDADLKKLDASYKCQFDDQKLTGTAKGSKFEASMKIQAAGEGARIQLEVQLPLLLTPFKGMIEKTLQKKLDSIIG